VLKGARNMSNTSKTELKPKSDGSERRQYRRHDLETQDLPINRWDGIREGKSFGKIVDLSAGGVRVRTEQANVKTDNQIRVRLELPAYAGIAPFVAAEGNALEPKTEWIGWMTVKRVISLEPGKFEIAGKLMDMDDMDRGMLGLYLSTQPMAA
jgi:hypothetical protein